MTTVPSLPVLVPLTVLAFALPAWRLRLRGALTVPRVAAVALACLYAAELLSKVILPFPVAVGAARDGLVPWHVFVNVVPLVTARQDPSGIELNTALFIPVGLLLPFLVREWPWKRVLRAGFALSLGIEIAQLLADVTVSTGRVADVDDLIGNTLGTLLGYLAFRAAALLPTVARLAAATAWPGAAAKPAAAEAVLRAD